MAPKITCNPAKLDAIVNYFRSSRVAHSIKDLEKHLPSVASINGMQVKDYLQALSDESKINVEKIGSGNWYWSFATQEHKHLSKMLADLRSTHDKAAAAVASLRQQLADKNATQRQVEDEQAAEALLKGSDGELREDLIAHKARLELELKVVKKDLEKFKGSDPAEMENKVTETARFRAEAMGYTDDIEAMEGWFRKHDLGECLQALRTNVFGDEFDHEEGCLRDLV